MSNTSDREYQRNFYVAVDAQQGLDPRRQYYVPIYEDPEMSSFDLVPRMRRVIEFSTNQSLQLLSGFRGSGKTSELIRLQDQLDAEGYRTVYMDIEEYFNTLLPLDSAKLPFALAAGFAYALNRDPSRKPLQRFWEFVKRVRPEFSGKVGASDLAELEVKAVIRDDTSFAQGAEDAFKTNRRVLRDEFHAFFSELLRDLDAARPIVFIVDSIDHWRGMSKDFEAVRDSVESAFTQLAPDLQIPNLHMIYTVPIYLAFPGIGIGVRADVVNIKLATKTGDTFAPGVDALRKVLIKRAPNGDLRRLLPDDLANQVITASGGQFRDLLRLVRLILLETPQLPATDSVVRKAEMALRSEYASVLTSEQLEILRKVHRSKEAFTSHSERSDETALVTLGAILRYPNDESTWYDSHPLLAPLLSA